MHGKCHEQRSLVGYSPWGRKESLSNCAHTHTHAHAHTFHQKQKKQRQGSKEATSHWGKEVRIQNRTRMANSLTTGTGNWYKWAKWLRHRVWEHAVEGCGLWQNVESCFSYKWQLLSNSQLCETVHPGSPVLPTFKKKLENQNFKRKSFLFNVGNEINWKAQQIKPSLQGCQSGTSATKSLTGTWLQGKNKKQKTEGFSSHSQDHCFCLTSLILSKRKPFKCLWICVGVIHRLQYFPHVK